MLRLTLLQICGGLTLDDNSIFFLSLRPFIIFYGVFLKTSFARENAIRFFSLFEIYGKQQKPFSSIFYKYIQWGDKRLNLYFFSAIKAI